LNWIRQDYAAWIQDLFDRVGLGFIIIKFARGSKPAKEAAEDMAKKWNRRSVIAMPVDPDQVRGGEGVEVVDVPTAGALVVQELIQYADKHLERLFLGQSMSSGESGREGMGGTAGPAKMAEQTKHQLLQADAEELAETLTGSEDEPGLCSIVQRWSYPGTLQKFKVSFRFMMDEPDPQPKIEAIVALARAGVEFDQDEARKLTGQPKPVKGANVFGGKTPVPTLPGAVPGAVPGHADEGEGDTGAEPGPNGNGKPAPLLNGKGA
jgi:hypothetical protein